MGIGRERDRGDVERGEPPLLTKGVGPGAGAGTRALPPWGFYGLLQSAELSKTYFWDAPDEFNSENFRLVPFALASLTVAACLCRRRLVTAQ
jgi:hypothetical protein